MKNFEEIKRLLDKSVLYYIIVTGMDGKYSYVNEHYSREFSQIHGELVGQPYHITMHPDDMKTCNEVAAKCFENPGRLFPATIRKLDGKGGFVYTQWEYKAMFDANQNPAGVFCLGYNITKFVADGELLRDAQSAIVKYSDTMNQISFQQSHLIRSPLSNIIGLTNLIDRSQLDVNTCNILDMLLESSQKLDTVIRSIVSAAVDENL